MPILGFRCKTCEEEFEYIKIRTDDVPPVECPRCESPDIEKTISTGTNFKLKGGGWFHDDY